ncbi:MAG: GerW family sporulation protein [Clostridia bacterium]|nr:GerW family sporulation protein [Clostridia bacterium]
MSESIKGIMDVTMEKLRSVVDAETIIGSPIKVDEVTLIPVSKISFGLASGGSDFPSKHTQNELFGGGGGAGVTISPVAFIVVHNDNVRMMPVYSEMNTFDKAVNMAPELFDKVKSLFNKGKKDDSAE